MATVRAYRRHAAGDDHIYCQMMAERTGEAADNYYGRPFDMDLLDYAPSAPQEEQRTWVWPIGLRMMAQDFGQAPGAYVPPGGHPDPRSLPGYPFPEDRR
jgi:hypothetical protein